MLKENRAQRVIELCRELVQLPSESGREEQVADRILQFGERNGFDEIVRDEYGSVILFIKGNRPGPTVLFDGHIDTVPVRREQWTMDPYGGEIRDGKLYGRGSSDMKGAVSAMLAAAVHFAEDTGKSFPGQIAVSASVHEECFEGVATRSISRRVRPDYVVIGEASHLNLNRGQRGRAEIVLETFGKSVHSSNPEKGVNAVYQMMKLLEAIRRLPPPRHPVLGAGIMELTDIVSSPYPGASVVPASCKVTFDRRLLAGETRETVLAPIQAIIARLAEEDPNFRATASFATGEMPCYTGRMIGGERFFPAWVFDEREAFVQASLQALRAIGLPAELGHYSFCTNGSHFAGEAGIPTVGFGPSLESMAHIDDEYIEIDQLIKAAAGYQALMGALTALQPAGKEVNEHG